MTGTSDELDRLAHEYYLSDPAGDIDIEELAQRQSFGAISRAIAGHQRVLEMGFGTGCITDQLLRARIDVEVVEGSSVLAAVARRRHPGLVVHEALFEEFQPAEPYDAVLALHVLEHVDDPVALARHLSSWLRPGGTLVAVCPNRESIHRRLAVRMGLQPELDTLSDRDRMVGHLRVYSLDGLAADLRAAGLWPVHRFGYLLKTLPNSMQRDHPPELLRAMSDIGEELSPALLANIGIAGAAVTSPLVSVLVPTYQGEAHIEETLRSILDQTYDHLEVIVSDDGSTDGTLDLVEGLAIGDRRVTVDAHDNIGIFANPVRLLRRANGSLVKYVLQDDLLDPTCIERLAAPMADPGISLSTSRRRRIDGTGQELPDIPATAAIVDRAGRMDGFTLGNHLLESQLNRIGELSTVLYRRDVLDPDSLWDFPGWAVRGNGDVVVHLKALAAGDAWYEPEVLSSFRTHEGQYGSRPEVAIHCTLDWPHLITGATAIGFLVDPAMERRALTAWLRYAGLFHASVADAPETVELLDAMAAAVARLRLLSSGERPPITQPWQMCSSRNGDSPAVGPLSSPASRIAAGT